MCWCGVQKYASTKRKELKVCSNVGWCASSRDAHVGRLPKNRKTKSKVDPTVSSTLGQKHRQRPCCFGPSVRENGRDEREALTQKCRNTHKKVCVKQESLCAICLLERMPFNAASPLSYISPHCTQYTGALMRPIPLPERGDANSKIYTEKDTRVCFLDCTQKPSEIDFARLVSLIGA